MFTLYQRVLIVAIIALAALLGGVVTAMRWLGNQGDNGDGQRLVITEITIGTPLSAAEAQKPNPKLRQKMYSTVDPIALRLTTSASQTKPYTVSVRLLTPRGDAVELNPSQATFSPGTSTYCCWTIPTPGSYSLQIFRPEQVITSIPLKIDLPQNVTRESNPLLAP